MPDARVMHMGDHAAFDAFAQSFEATHPTLRFGRFSLDAAEAQLKPELGGMKVFWLHAGEGEVYLPAGYRTKEGDGGPLPGAYEPEPASSELAEALAVIRDGLDSMNESARPPAQAILSRWGEGTCTGDYAGDLWKLEHVPRPWSSSPQVEAALSRLFPLCMGAGYSRKTTASWERIMEGDQLAVAGNETLRIRGRFTCLTLEKRDRTSCHVPAAMRLRYLKDTSGGCNFDFDPFRRLPLTWYIPRAGSREEGINFANSHVVNIARETSPSHFHPPHGIGGGAAQNEFYLVLDPAAYGLHTYGRRASLVTYPDLTDLHRFDEHALEPGSFVHIPPGTGHRGIDVFVNVITVPGFKPHNEYYMDADIKASAPEAPCNENLLHLKNYESIAALLEPGDSRV